MEKRVQKWMIGALLVFSICVYQLSPKKSQVGFLDLDITQIQGPAKENLSGDEVRRDLEVLLYALDSTYAGRLAYPEEYLLMTQRLRELSNSSNDVMTKVELIEKLSAILNKFPDGHLHVNQNPDGYVIKQERYLASKSEDSVGKAAVEFMDDKRGRNTLLFRAPTFLVDDNTRDLFASFSDNLNKADKVVIDLRGNSGGFLDVPQQVAARLWGENYREGSKIQYFPSPFKNSYILNNNSAYQLRENFHLLSRPEKLVQQRNINRNIFTKIMNFNEYAEGSFGKSLFVASDFAAHTDQDINVYEDEPENLQEKGFNKPIVIIVDKECASACELFLESLEKHPKVTVIGERTAGASQFGFIGLVQLPNSQIMIPVATAYMEYKDKRRIERVGYPPHIVVEPADAIKKALAL